MSYDRLALNGFLFKANALPCRVGDFQGSEVWTMREDIELEGLERSPYEVLNLWST